MRDSVVVIMILASFMATEAFAEIIASTSGIIGHRGIARSQDFVYLANTLHGLEIVRTQQLAMVTQSGSVEASGTCLDMMLVGSERRT